MAKVTVIGQGDKRIQPKDVRQFGVQGYDIDNLYPQRIEDSLAASVTGDAAQKLFATHLIGRGFALPDLGKTVVNPEGQTLSEIHELICADFSKWRGVALHIGYNGLLEPVSVRHVPFSYIRLKIEDDLGNVDSVVVYEDWDKSKWKNYKTERMKTVDLFTEDTDKIANQIAGAGGFDKWNGHILFYSADGRLVYPKAKCDPCFEDVITEAGIKKFYQRMVQTGFMAGAVFVHKGKFEDEEARDEFKAGLNNYQGTDNSHTMMMVEAETDEQIPEIKEFPIINNDKLFETTEPTVRDRIIRCFEQPLILHAIKTPGSLGESTEWQDAVKNYDGKTEKDRERIALLFSKIFTRWAEGQINPDNNWAIIPLSGVEEKTKRSVLATKIGVGGMQSLQAILQDTTMQPANKINFLIIVFGVSPEDADALVNGTKIQN